MWEGADLTSAARNLWRGHETYFVFSLSAVHDDLSQWRAYCPQGGGYSIGFEARRLAALASRAGFELRECVYDPEVHLRQIEGILDEAIATYPGFRATAERAAEWQTRLYSQVMRAAPVFKDPAFRAEAEWRLVSPVVPVSLWEARPLVVEIREGRGLPRLYTKIPIASMDPLMRPIHAILCGPGPYLHDVGLVIAQDVFTLRGQRQPLLSPVLASQVPQRNS